MTNNNSIPAFGFARKTSKIINRAKEMGQLTDAVSGSGQDTRIVFMTGDGGSGKTRLLEELQAVITSGDTAQPLVVTNVIDFTDTRLHVYTRFLDYLHQMLVTAHEDIFFPKWEVARITYLNRAQSAVDYDAIKTAADKLKTAFWEDYADIAKNQRIVWLLDTAEQFRYTWQGRLRNLFETDDFLFFTRDFLKNLVGKNLEQIPNTTIIFAGRPNARPYFDEIMEARKKNAASPPCRTISVKFFEEEDTQTYLAQLAADIETDFPDSYDAARLHAIAKGKGEVDPRVLHAYTKGQPIRLSLFIDILLEGYELPGILFDSCEEAGQRIAKAGLKNLQPLLDAGFVDLIFESTHDVRSDILLALARARYGLSNAQLAWILYSKPGATYTKWKHSKEAANAEDEIDAIFTHPADTNTKYALNQMSFIKRSVDGRWILQDEVYSIFDDRMGLPKNLERERKSRNYLYQKIIQFIDGELTGLKAQRKIYLDKDQDSLVFPSPAKALGSTFAYIDDNESEERRLLKEKIELLERERLHYRLRSDLEEGLQENHRRTERLGFSDSNQHTVARLNVWQLSTPPDRKHDRQSWKKFISFPKETPQTEVEAMLQAQEAADLISTFFFRGQYSKTIDIAQKIEDAIEHPASDEESFPLQLKYLQHPLFEIQRAMWKEFAEIYTAQGINIEDVQTLIDKLTDYLSTADEADPVHKLFSAQIRDALGNLYNTLGYAYTTRGQYQQASEAYKQALKQWRANNNLFMDATTRNNQARVLSELGLVSRAERICRDALAIRTEMAVDQPIGFSRSTLALIYNNGLRPENAWLEAAIGIAYHRRAESKRGLGLAHFHLAEALRRLTRSPKETLDTEEHLLKTAEQAIKTAREIFDKETEEPLRKIEILIEQGALYRDYVRYYKGLQDKSSGSPAEDEEKKKARFWYEQALKTFNYAVKLAEEYSYQHLKLDALVDIAWVHYYARHDGKALEAFAVAKKEAHAQSPDSELKPNQLPPVPKGIEPHIFMRLAKLWDLKARIHLNKFIANKDAGELEQSVEAYILDLGYNLLYSPRAPFIAVIFNNLYERLKGFSLGNLEKFDKRQKYFTQVYQIEKIDAYKIIDMDSFLDDSFGIGHE